MIKIAHVVEAFSPLSETFIYDKLKNLEDESWSQKVFTFKIISDHRELQNVTELKSSITLIDRVVFKLAKLVGSLGLMRYVDFRIYRKSLTQNLIDYKPDLIYAHFGPAGIISLQAAKKLNVPIVLGFYGYDISILLQSRFWKKQYLKNLSKFDALIGISNFICQKIINLKVPAHKVHLIHLGIPLSKVRHTYPSKRVSDNQIFCIFVGRLVDKKSPLDLIKSFSVCFNHALVKQKGLSLKLRIVGDGPLYSDCLKLIQELGLTNVVEMLGAIENDEVLELLESSHIYTQHSVTAPNGDQEGQGVTLVEASAKGLPVVVTNHNGFSDVVIHNESGLLSPEKDHQAMADNLVQLVSNIEAWDEFGQKGINNITSEFDISKETVKTKILINSLLNNRK